VVDREKRNKLDDDYEMKEPKRYNTRETKDENTNEEINWKRRKKRVVKF